MSTPPSDLPPPPPAETPPPAALPTQITGQQTAPSSAVPGAPTGMVTAAPSTNTLAVVSLVAAIGSFFGHIIPGIGGFTIALIAVITGHMAKGQIKRTGEGGMMLANIALIIAYVHLALIVLGVIVVIFLIFVFGIALFGISAHSTGGG